MKQRLNGPTARIHPIISDRLIDALMSTVDAFMLINKIVRSKLTNPIMGRGVTEPYLAEIRAFMSIIVYVEIIAK